MIGVFLGPLSADKGPRMVFSIDLRASALSRSRSRSRSPDREGAAGAGTGGEPEIDRETIRGPLARAGQSGASDRVQENLHCQQQGAGPKLHIRERAGG